jgi:hypothetical protein
MDQGYKILKSFDGVNGSHRQGHIQTRYDDLVRMFGEPMESDGYKVDAEWVLKFDDGKIATIYNWKNGRNYMGKYGQDVFDITNWNIGGHHEIVVNRIHEIIGERG